MAKMQTTTTPGARTDNDDTGKPARMMTTERWLAVYMLGALGFLVLTRRAFSDFVPR
jgi:hypothetical protein